MWAFTVHGYLPRTPNARARKHCHTCDNRACINPDHLFLGTQKENVRDMMNKGRNVVPNRKLNYKKVEEIRSLYNGGGFTQQKLADMYGVARTTIQPIVEGRTWLGNL